MIRFLWLARCVVLAVSLAALHAKAQEADDLFAPANPSAVQDPFRESQPGPASPTEKSVLTAAPANPAATDKATTEDFCQCVGETNSESVARIERALQGKLTSAGFDFAEAPLEEVVSFIQDTYNIPVILDFSALEEIGVGPDEPINTSMHGISLRSALRHMLKQLQLTYVIHDEVLLITTPEEAESQLAVCVYDVRDLVDGPKDAAGVNALIETIIETVVHDSWAVHGGGEAAIRSVNGGLIVVSQTQAVHEEMRGLLETIRNVKKEQPGADGDIEKSAAEANPGHVITKAYFLSLGQPADPEEVLVQVRHLIENAIPDVRWQGRLENGEAVWLTVLPDRIVLKNKTSVHQEVERLLADSGLAAPQAQARGMAGGFGGGMGGGGFGGQQGGGFFRPRVTK